MNLNHYNKSAAMFGLDARIALAIFGALSVITGAALYSAIQQAKVTAMITEMKEIGKAVEAFILDTGQNIPSVTGDDSADAQVLLNNNKNIKGWNGPYVSFKEFSSGDRCMTSSRNSFICIEIYRETPFSVFGDSGRICRKTDKVCYYWVAFQANKDILQQIEKKIDGTQNPGLTNLDGNFTYDSTIVISEDKIGYGSLNLQIPFNPLESKN